MSELLRHESPLAKWPGAVYTNQYLSFPELISFEEIMTGLKGSNITLRLMYEKVLPTVCEFVKKWELPGVPEQVTPEQFPGSADLLNWVVGVITSLVSESGETDPNSPKPPSTA